VHPPMDYPAGTPLPLTFATYDDAMEWHDTELPSILALLRLAVRLGEHDIAAALPISMWRYLIIRHRMVVMIETHIVALESARLREDKRTQAVAANHLAIGYADSGRLDLSLDHFTESLRLRTEIGDDWGRAATLNNLGAVHLRMRNHGTATVHHEQALELFRQIDDKTAVAQTLNNLGEVWLGRGDVGKAIDHHNAAIAMLRELKEDLGLVQALDNLGNAYLADGRYHEAIEALDAAATLAHTIGDDFDEGSALCRTGRALGVLGRTEDARRAWQSALPLLERTDDTLAAEVRDELSRLGE
jgi:tetratricopeptide (TPR) repeat protein